MKQVFKAHSFQDKYGIKGRYVIGLLILALLLYIVLPQIGSFRSSFHLLANAQLSWVLVGVLFYAGTNLTGALLYKILAPVRLRYGRNLIVQLAGSFANRLLPAGVGALGVSYRYLRKQKASEPQALAVVTLNNILGGVGNLALLIVILIAAPNSTRQLVHPQVHVSSLAVFVGIIVILTAAVLLALHFWRHLWGLIKSTLAKIGGYRHEPAKLAAGLTTSIALTACFAGCLWASARALGVDIDYPQALIVMTVSVAVGTLIPSPGGLGGVEAGLVAALVAYGFPAHAALASALLFRLLTYWLGLILGAFALVAATHRRYI